MPGASKPAVEGGTSEAAGFRECWAGHSDGMPTSGAGADLESAGITAGMLESGAPKSGGGVAALLDLRQMAAMPPASSRPPDKGISPEHISA